MIMEEWEVELKKQKEEVEEEVGPILKHNEGQLSYQQYLEELVQALERAKEKYCKRHCITKEEYDGTVIDTI